MCGRYSITTPAEITTLFESSLSKPSGRLPTPAMPLLYEIYRNGMMTLIDGGT